MQAFTLLALALAAASPAVAIVGGGESGGAFADRVVAVLTRGPQGSGLCTGVVLSSRVILTAAHCLRPAVDMAVLHRDAAGAPALIEIEATLPHPDFHPDAVARRIRSIDVGLIETRTPLPESFRPAAMAEDEPPPPGQAVVVVGFGVAREGEPKTGGTLRAARLAVREPISKVLLWTAPASGTAGACSGDSGGPIFDAEGKNVVAIIAWTAGERGRRCGDLTQGVLLAPLRDWIAARLARWTR